MTRLLARISFLFFCVSFALVLVPSNFAHAAISDSDVSIETNPEVPGPFEKVVISLTSFSFDLSRAKITWTQGGVVKKTGFGEKQYSFTTGGIGQVSTVDLSIQLGSEPAFSRRITINPSVVDLLVESLDTYTPPFYRGKAIPTTESIVRIVAIPVLKQTNGGALSYTWKKDGNVVGDFSGYGKSSYTFGLDYLKPSETISVVAETTTGSYQAENAVTISPQNPQILFYEYRPLLGTLWQHALDPNETMTGTEYSILAEPYFFAPKNMLSKNLTFSWKLNGDDVETPARKNKLVLKRSMTTSGTTNVSLSLEEPDKLFQIAKSSLSLTY